MPRRNALLKIDIAEQRSRRLVRPAHHHPRRRRRAKSESCSRNRVEPGVFQQPAKPASFLSGRFENAKTESDVLSFLFAVNGKSAASSFGSHVIYTLNNPTFTTDTFANLSLIQPPGKVPVAPISFSITQAAAPIPCPPALCCCSPGSGRLASPAAAPQLDRHFATIRPRPSW